MATITIDITTNSGEQHTYHADPDDMPLTLLEAMAEGNPRLMREGIATFLNIPPAVSVQLTVRHIKQIGAAIKQVNESPNA